jgi:hypothetical protein
MYHGELLNPKVRGTSSELPTKYVEKGLRLLHKTCSVNVTSLLLIDELF